MRVLQYVSARLQRPNQSATAGNSSPYTTERTRVNTSGALLFLASVVSVIYITMPAQEETTTTQPSSHGKTTHLIAPSPPQPTDVTTSVISTPELTKVTVNGETYETTAPNDTYLKELRTENGSVHVRVTRSQTSDI